MKLKANAPKLLIPLLACAVIALAATTQAQDKKAGATGTWTWTTAPRGGGPDRTNTLALKAEGDKLTGTLSSPRRGGEIMESPIESGKVAGDDISFSVTRDFGGNSVTSKYSGKLSGDTITGKIEFERDGEAQSRDWEAKRQGMMAGSKEKTDKADKH